MEFSHIRELESQGLFKVVKDGDNKYTLSGMEVGEDALSIIAKDSGWEAKRVEPYELVVRTGKMVKEVNKSFKSLFKSGGDLEVSLSAKPSVEYGKNVYIYEFKFDNGNVCRIIEGASNSGGKFCLYKSGSPIAVAKSTTISGCVNSMVGLYIGLE